ncbi:type I restriction-modification system endonuclease [bacterium SCSIO 12643]|nr:type I restriction-modification system endonuclease [bacterium SCSIO 12643]
MSQSNFKYLEKEFSLLYNIGLTAEYNLYQDPVTTLFKLRLFGEKLTDKIYEEHYLEFPYDSSFHNKLKTLQYENLLPDRVRDLLFTIKNKGNVAVHDSKGSVDDAKTALFSAFKVAKWFYSTYAKELTDISTIRFSLPENLDARHALAMVEKEYKILEEKFTELLQQREIKEEPAAQRKAVITRSESAARNIDMSEAETRVLIDEQLINAGWEANTAELNYKTNKTRPQKGKMMAIAEWPMQNKWADYALFIGKELYGIVEAKKYANDISTDLTQAKVYASLAEAKNDAQLIGEWDKYKVPFLFATNGRPYLEQIKTKSGIWFLDIRNNRNRARPLRGWFSPEGLKELLEQDLAASNKQLEDSDISYLKNKNGLGLRDYQIQAIQAVEQKIATQPDDRKALLAMATGTGKTRTIMGLCYRLIKANRFRRILFLVDRTLLATQAIGSFKDNKIEDLNTFSETYKVEGLKEIIPDLETRLHFATVQGMVKRLFYSEEGESKLSIDTYDCIIVDEAHRGYLQDKEMDDEELNFKNQKDYVSKYRMVLDYFDAYAVGLTATPALHTSQIFGHPVFTYSYREAVIDGFLIDHDPPYIIKTKLSEEGIVWEKGAKPKVYDQETNSIVEMDAIEDELSIDISGFNKMVITEPFNRTVVKQLVQELDPEGEEKSLIFAARDEHADLIVEYLKEEFENIGVDVPDEAIVKITGKSYDPQGLLTQFKNEKYPNIAVTVDLLTTGVDVPAISNLVFLRRIKSRILYEQMLGRATRRCDDIGKEVFRIFDAVRVYETLEDYTSMKPVSPNPSTTFTQLAEEMELIESNERARKQLEQIIAKLQRKRKKLSTEDEERFRYNAEGKDPDSFIDMLKDHVANESPAQVMQYAQLWKFLDEYKSAPALLYWAEQKDEYLTTERGYGKGEKPEDYLDSFSVFIKQNLNKIAALQIICRRPKELDRQSLKELKMLLDENGFNARTLNTAWKASKNEDIAADIISYIRTLAMGNALVNHEDRISNAVSQVRSMRSWNKIQLKWIDRFEKQLLQENIIQPGDLDTNPFQEAGGFKRLNKIFDNQLDEVLNTINDNLYPQIA